MTDRGRSLRAVPDIPDLEDDEDPNDSDTTLVEPWSVDLPETDDELDAQLDIEGGAVMPVDLPDDDARARDMDRRTVTGSAFVLRHDLDQRPVLPAWMLDPGQRREAAAWATRFARHWAAFHGVRLVTTYPARAAARVPVGAARAVTGTARWVTDAEARPLRVGAVEANDPKTYLLLARERADRVRRRAYALGGTALGAAGGTGALAVLAPGWAQLAALTGVAVGLAALGRTPDRPIIDTAVVVPRARKLSADVVERAFIAAGLCTETDLITFPAPITRDGPGWLAVIDLPYRTTAAKAVKARESIAAGLDLDELLVWPERVRGTTGSARRMRLWVADEDPYAKPSGAWPLIEHGTVDLFEPFPFGQDQRGRPVPLQLMFTNMIVGSIPRMGKTFAARLPALAAALDPTAELHVWDGKGGKDWRGFAQVAHRIGFGARDAVVRALLDDLRELVQRQDDRYDRMAELPTSVVPNSRVTRDVASRRGLDLHPVVIAIDEFQQFSEHPEHGEEIVDCLVKLAKVGPAVGFIMILSTQKPDAVAIPTRLRDVIGTRFALKCMTWQASDAVLGSGAYKAGQSALGFLRSHKGVGWLVGADDSGAVEEAVTVRTYFADGPNVDQVLTRARAVREAAGLLTGMAAGEMPETAAGDPLQVLVDVLGVWPLDEDRMWSSELVERLALAHTAYTGWTPDTLAGALKPHGISTRQLQKTIDGERVNRRGLDRGTLVKALSDRNELPAARTQAALTDRSDDE